jgi:hypothetical protein
VIRAPAKMSRVPITRLELFLEDDRAELLGELGAPARA